MASLLSVKALSKVLGQNSEKLKAISRYNTNKLARIMEQTLFFLPKNLWKSKVCGRIFGRYNLAKIAISNHSEAAHENATKTPILLSRSIILLNTPNAPNV
jgi:hypothetical protein